jgi:predicted nuclease with TOPRIM domain
LYGTAQPLNFDLERLLNPKKIYRQQLTEAHEETFEDVIAQFRGHVHLQIVKREDAVSMYRVRRERERFRRGDVENGGDFEEDAECDAEEAS